MPPRFAYWTIITGGQPTAFRAATREELLPTLKQLQSKQPDAVMTLVFAGEAVARLPRQRPRCASSARAPDRSEATIGGPAESTRIPAIGSKCRAT